MRVSAKARYALAALVTMAQQCHTGEYITVISISEKLGISKIYLEQVFSLLKRGEIVTSIKGAQGGYQLTRSPGQITVYDVLSAIETSLFEKAEDTVSQTEPAIDSALHSVVFDTLDAAIKDTLEKITLDDILNEAERQKKDQALMFYI